MDLKEIKSLIKLLEDTGLTEIEVEEAGRRVRVRKEPGHGTAPVLVYGAGTVVPQNVAESPAPVGLLPPAVEVLKETGLYCVAIPSPIVGTFYRAHTQGAEPYVKVGDLVKKGQILCIVEAMKLMNEIESDIDGTISDVCVEDKASVEFGQPLFKIEPLK